MDYLRKFEYDDCALCIMYFANRRCHVALTTRNDPQKQVKNLVRSFGKKQLEVVGSDIIALGSVNYWNRVHDKYQWRFLMYLAGFEIVNQNGTVFHNVESETWDQPKRMAMEMYLRHAIRPAISIVRAECVKRRRNFLPQQVIRKAIIGSSEEQRKYNEFEKRLFDTAWMKPEIAGSVNFRHGVVKRTSGMAL